MEEIQVNFIQYVILACRTKLSALEEVKMCKHF